MAWDARRRATLGVAVVLGFAIVTSGCGSGAGGSGRPAASGSAAVSPSAGRTASARPAEAPAPGDHELALDHAGKQVQYEVHAPPTFRPGRKLPLVVAIHYRGGDVPAMRQMTRLDAAADREDFLVAYPCCGSAEDVDAIRAIVEHLVQAWDADPTRVYATGMSAGAQTVVDLAVDAPGVFAAIAPVSGGFQGSRAADDPAYKPSRPVSVVSFIGSRDRAAGAMELGLGRWRERLRCTPGPTAWVDAGKTVSRTPARCADGSDVVAYTISGMGHSWPGGADAGLGDSSAKINATQVIWDFFAAHERRG